MVYNINDFVQLTQNNSNKNLWEEVEEKNSIIFPKDYKTFIDLYGVGGFNEFLWILSPFCDNENLNSIEKFKLTQEAYNCMKNEFPEQFLYKFYNGKEGLFPWGITENGDELFWNYKKDTIEIVIFEARYISCVRYSMGTEEFLCKLLNKEIVCSIFPDDFVLESNYYESL